MKISALVLVFCCLGSSSAWLVAQDQALLTPDLAWQRLKDGNSRFAADRSERKDLGASKRQGLVKGQHPFAIVLACADSRVPPEHIFHQGLGDIFVIRVPGNYVDTSIIGAIEYAVEHLHVPLIVVLGHEDCGVVKAAMSKDRPDGNLGKLLNQIHIGKDLPKDKDEALAAATRNNVRYQTDLLTRDSDVIRQHVIQKKLAIVSGVYLLSTGKVEWFNRQLVLVPQGGNRGAPRR